MAECPKCEGTGWKPVLVDGKPAVIPCECKQIARAAAEKERPGGFESIGGLSARRPDVPNNFPPLHRHLIEILARHLGHDRAVAIRNLGPQLYGDGDPHDREIKALVRELRRAGLKIGSKRTEPAGYFMITNARELAATIAPLLRQAIDELRTIEALTGRGYYARELEGQMRLLGERR